jgi:hypothetical protein
MSSPGVLSVWRTPHVNSSLIHVYKRIQMHGPAVNSMLFHNVCTQLQCTCPQRVCMLGFLSSLHTWYFRSWRIHAGWGETAVADTWTECWLSKHSLTSFQNGCRLVSVAPRKLYLFLSFHYFILYFVCVCILIVCSLPSSFYSVLRP